jgi:hypothetical protein
VVQVDVVVVREHELDVPQRIARAGPLADAHRSLQHGVQMVLREVGDGLAAAGDELETLLREVGAVRRRRGTVSSRAMTGGTFQ